MKLHLAPLVALASACHSARPTEHVPAPGAIGPYSAAVESGDFVFVSGRIGRTDGAPFEDEVETTITALEVELKRCGATLADVVTVTVYLTDMQSFEAMNAVYARRFTAPYPARTTVAVSGLPAEARIEITAVARRP